MSIVAHRRADAAKARKCVSTPLLPNTALGQPHARIANFVSVRHSTGLQTARAANFMLSLLTSAQPAGFASCFYKGARHPTPTKKKRTHGPLLFIPQVQQKHYPESYRPGRHLQSSGISAHPVDLIGPTWCSNRPRLWFARDRPSNAS